MTKVAIDTNVLVRLLTEDDVSQARTALTELALAGMVAVPVHTLCELVWVLSRAYKVALPDIAEAIRNLMADARVATDRPAVQAGLAMLEAGSDFADGVIAYQGRWLGAEEFISFDHQAVTQLQGQGRRARLLV